MRCLYCGVQFQDQNSLKTHYEIFHNWFYKALFEENKEDFFGRKCYRCESFLTSEREEKEHNFLFHFQKGGTIPLEDRPITVINHGIFKKFEIRYDEHKISYDFEHPVKLVKYFFGVVDIKFITDRKQEFIIKSSFTILNYQPPLEDINIVVGLYDKRIWSIQTYFGRFFNEYIRVSLTNDIKKEL